MIAGLPWTAWLLVLAAVGLGPALVIPFYLNQRRSNAGRPGARSDAADPGVTD